MISITPIPAFNDNYLWLIHDEENAIVVDPGDATPVRKHLETNGLNLVAILVTHHHGDHIGGVKTLKNQYDCTVLGPVNESIPGLDKRCDQGDSVEIPELAISFKVLAVPGHTGGHIAYFAAKNDRHGNLLFCGDTVFSVGCGRLFEGTPAQMWNSMQKILALPDDTQIYPAHEYTLSNISFAVEVEPQNAELKSYADEAKRLRNNNLPTLPAVLKREKAVNPFLRVKHPDVIRAAQARTEFSLSGPADVFKVIRQWKDTF